MSYPSKIYNFLNKNVKLNLYKFIYSKYNLNFCKLIN